jgi:parvulin-like peptidyl-prolyl isomerase
MRYFIGVRAARGRKVVLALLSLGLSALFIPAQTNKPPGSARDRLAELFGDPVVAKGKGFEIKRTQLDAEVLRTKEALAMGQRPVPPDVERQVLDGMISLKLLLAKATDADRAKAKEQFEKQFNTFKTERKLTEEEFNEKLAPQLKLEGRTRADWEQQQIEQLTIPIVIQREVNVPVTEDQAKKYYEDNVPKFEQPEMVRIAHIMFSSHDPSDPTPNLAQKRELPQEQKKAKRKLADDILKRARDGEDFTKLARDYSDDIDVKQNGGEIKLARDGFAPEEFKAAAFALKTTNQVSDVTTSVLGYHIIKLLERIPARKEPYAGIETKTIIPKADGTKFTIRDALNEEAIRKQLPDLVKKMRQEAAVEVLEPKLRIEETTPPTTAGSK